MPLLNNLRYQHCPKNVRWFEIKYIIFREDFYKSKTRKKLKKYIVVTIKRSINENTQRPQTETILNLVGMS